MLFFYTPVMGIFLDIFQVQPCQTAAGSHRELAEQQIGREGGRRAASICEHGHVQSKGDDSPLDFGETHGSFRFLGNPKWVKTKIDGCI
jgi:hypothetical protein